MFHGASLGLLLEVVDCETGGTFSPYLVGSHGERGLGQWLPGRGNAWDATPAYRELGVDIVAEYRAGNPQAWHLDIDMLAWSFGASAPRGLRAQWTCP